MPVSISACPSAWFVYLVRCRDGSLYCGIAKDLARRLAEHNSADKGAKYTRGRQPVQLIYTEEVDSRAKATQREGRIKKMSRTKKMALIIASHATCSGNLHPCISLDVSQARLSV